MSARDWRREVNWVEAFTGRAKELQLEVERTVLTRLEQEIQAKNDLIESTGQLLSAMRSLAEDSASEAMKLGRKEIRIEDLEVTLKECRPYPFC